jgi:hypothetical protein
MVKLGDLVGALLADAAQARVHADLEAVRIAEAYSANELLRNLPVPRFRLPDITVDLPVLIARLDAGGKPGAEAPDAKNMLRATREALAAGGIRIGTAARDRIVAALVERAKQLVAREPDAPIPPSQAASALAAEFESGVLENADVKSDDSKVGLAREALRRSMQALWAGRVGAASSLQVLTTAAEIKAHQNPESVVHVRLTITEDAYEIVRRDDGSYVLGPE